MNLEMTEKDFDDYLLKQIGRISKRYGVVLGKPEVRILNSFVNEHATNSHQLCDLVELVVRIVQYRKEG